MDVLVVGFFLDYMEDLVWKLRGDLVHGECHIFDVKDLNFGALENKI